MILSENNFHAWKLPCECSYLSGFAIFIYQTNKSTSCPMYSNYKSYLCFKERTFSKNSLWQKPPTHTYPLEPSGSVFESLPFLTEAFGLNYWDSCCIPTSFMVSLSSMHSVAATHLPCRFPSIQVLFKKKIQKKTHL